jgi:hypothetical protein
MIDHEEIRLAKHQMARRREKQGEGDETGEKEKVIDDVGMVLNGEGGDGESGGGERKCLLRQTRLLA